MNAPLPNFDSYQLKDRYERTEGRVFLTGTQALVRIMLDQARRDRVAGLNTGGFVSGYRGSPLGGVDLEMWRSRAALDAARITFMPAVNEDLGATAVLGSQQAALDPDCVHDGIFSMWYGKGPGVDRSGDALRHGNAYGSSPKGGVLVVAGDDHGCVSSSMPHQSDVAFMSWFVPTLNPASVEEYLSFGAYGIALSRFSGAWVGFKAVSETVESARSVLLPPERRFALPEIDLPPGGLHVRAADLPSTEIETRIAAKLAAVEAFVEANPIDRKIYDIDDASFGIVTTGKAHLDTMEALRLLGLDEAACRRLGIDIYKVGMVWPLARRDALNFVGGKREVLVIEEKRGIIESQFKEYFYDWPGHKPEKMVGKHRAAGDPLLPWTGELSPLQLVPVIAERLDRFFPDENLPARARHLTETPPVLNLPGATRTPYFCSGCPHNSSTKLPDGSKAASGIGCHVMASWMNRNTVGYAQMGGEGVPWVAASKFTGNRHMFQNLGEGTWYHSGSLAIRQAVAAGTNITYKILFNDAVAMTGGQPVDGPISVEGIAQTCRAEGVQRIAVVSDDIGALTREAFPPGTSFHDRGDLDPLQRELREVPGVSVLIYQQACATEKRRRRKRGTLDDPPRFAWINAEVCEGCGDCSVESNCLSVEPRRTELGRKRKINLSSCNKDFSCLNGFCPSFVTIEGGTRRKEAKAFDLAGLFGKVPHPEMTGADRVFDLMVAGVGGTGVVTIGALITMAAHLEGRGASVLDFTGFAQKFGTVIGYVRLAPAPEDIHQVRIEEGSADAMIGCDAVVASAPKASIHLKPGHTKVVLNRAEMPTGDLVLNRDASLQVDQREAMVASVTGAENLWAFDANSASEELMGEAVYANVIMLGAAWQKGLVPVSEGALKQAMLLNGVAVETNMRAFDIGRILAHSPDALAELMRAEPTRPKKTADEIAQLVKRLADYQDQAYADRFRSRIDQFSAALPETIRADVLPQAARGLHKFMAIKDEYEVARHLISPAFEAELAERFAGDYRVTYHLAPPLVTRARDARGRPVKRAFGPWLKPLLRGMARMRFLRGTWADPFGRTADRQLDRALLVWFEGVLDRIVALADRATPAQMTAILTETMQIRGYGPVRERAAEKAQAKVETMLAEIEDGP